MIYFYACIAGFLNGALFMLAWPSIRAHTLRRRLKRLNMPVLTWETYQRHKVIVKVGE